MIFNILETGGHGSIEIIFPCTLEGRWCWKPVGDSNGSQEARSTGMRVVLETRRTPSADSLEAAVKEDRQQIRWRPGGWTPLRSMLFR